MNAPLKPSALVVAGDRARPPRVLHVVRQFLPNRGGLEDVVHHLCREQLRRGIDARVLTLDRLFRRLDVRLPAHETIDGIAIRRIPFRGSTRYPVAPHVLGELGGADLVHVHAVDFFFDALALSRPLHRKPLVATTHGGFFHTRAFSGLKALWFNGPTRLSASAYGAVVGCSDNDAATFARIAGARVRTIENGVDLAKFTGASSATPVKRLVSLGRFSANKRPDRLIDALAALERTEPGWHLDLVGVESDWTAARLNAKICAAGLADKVTLHVGLDDRDAAAVLRTCSLFVSASEFEGFGLALVEAMSAGLVPVVQPNAAFAAMARRQPGVALADFGDPVAAAGAIRTAFARLVAGAARTSPGALASYAWPEVARRYVELYATLDPAFAAMA